MRRRPSGSGAAIGIRRVIRDGSYTRQRGNNMHPAKDEFLRRIRSDQTYSASARQTVENAFLIHEIVKGRQEQLAADGRFSEMGKRQALAEFVQKEVLN